MPVGTIPIFQVLYVSGGVCVAERTLESTLTIPLELDAPHVNAIVRTIMPSDANTDGYRKGLNECRFHLNLIDKHFYAPRNISLLPVAPNMAELTWQHPISSNPEEQEYKVIYTYGKKALSTDVTGSLKFQLPIEDGAMGIEAQVATIRGEESEDRELYSSKPVLLELSEDGEFEFVV
ncbi:hypothetical protein ACTXT7_017372, partial [Hymenolepis weldensis]